MELLDRVRAAMPGAEEKRMFGGVGFMVEGALAVSVGPQGLLVRVGPEAQPRLLEREGVTPMTMRERVSRGWVHVDPSVLVDEPALRAWLARGIREARGPR